MMKPPERRSEIRDAQKRIQSATNLFETNFYNDGRPKTKEGKKLYKKYYVPGYGESYKFSISPLRRLRLRIRSLIRSIWRKLDPPICGHCGELVEGMIMGISINYLSNTWYHYSCYQEWLQSRSKK